MRDSGTLAAIVLSFTLAGAVTAATIPFSDGFETNSAGDDLDAVEGASGWETTDGVGGSAVSGRAIVQTTVKSAGANGVILTNGTLANDFSTAGLSNVWTSFDIQPVFHEGTPTPPDSATVAFYFFSNGNIRAFNGQTISNLGNTTISTSAFNSVTIRSDYGAATYDLYLGGSQVASGLGFYSNLTTSYDELIIDQDEITQPAYLDEADVNANSPLTPTISWSGDSTVTNNEGTVRVLTAILNFSAQITVTASVSEVDITTESGDITIAAQPEIIIASGSTSGTASVTITDDPEHETPFETDDIRLTSANATVGSFSNVNIVINDDDDTPPNLYFLGLSGSGTESGLGTVGVSARLDGNAQEDVAVTVTTGGTATEGAGDDYTVNNASLNFTAGNMTPDSGLEIVVIDDSVDEGTETVILTMPDGSGTFNTYPAVVASNTYTLTITDDDVGTLPFVETFDTALTPLGDLNGNHGWSSSNTVVTAASGQSKFSSQSAYSSNSGALANTFTDSSATNVFTTFYIQPTFGEAIAAAIPSNASVVFFVNATGSVVAYNAGVATVQANALIATNGCPKFTIHSDYIADKYDLYLDDVLLVSQYDFFTNIAPSSFTEFNVGGDGNSSSIVDSINISIDNPFYAITSVIEQVAGNTARIFIDNGANGSSYRLLKKSQNDSSFGLLLTKTMGSVPHFFDDSTIGTETTRQYKVTNFSVEGEGTNEATWIAQQQFRSSNTWHMVSLPGQFGASNLNTLNNELGDELKKGLTGNATEALAPAVWIYEGGWAFYWLGSDGNFHATGAGGVTASNVVEPGEGVWVKANLVADDSGILAGQVHTSSIPISMPSATWVLFSWPFPNPEANSVAGWGFSNTFTMGTTWDNASRMFMQDGNQFYNLYLGLDGIWKIQNTTTDAPVSLRPGQAYYFYNPGGTASFTAAPAN
jgi:hypothetical protein